jgi:hypothetical protein
MGFNLPAHSRQRKDTNMQHLNAVLFAAEEQYERSVFDAFLNQEVNQVQAQQLLS